MIYVHMGNPCPVNGKGLAEGEVCDHCGDVDVQHLPVVGPELFMWSYQDSPRGEQGHMPLIDCVRSVTAGWKALTWDEDPTPPWVESNSASLQTVLADMYGCPVGRPDGFVTASNAVLIEPVTPSAVDPLAEPGA
jgi:hypothetical protein